MKKRFFVLLPYYTLTSAGTQRRASYRLLTVAEVAKRCDRAPRTIRQWCDEGKVIAHKFDGHWHIWPQSIGKICRSRRD